MTVSHKKLNLVILEHICPKRDCIIHPLIEFKKSMFNETKMSDCHNVNHGHPVLINLVSQTCGKTKWM